MVDHKFSKWRLALVLHLQLKFYVETNHVWLSCGREQSNVRAISTENLEACERASSVLGICNSVDISFFFDVEAIDVGCLHVAIPFFFLFSFFFQRENKVFHG